MPGISAVKTGIPFSKKGFNFSSYWTPQRISNPIKDIRNLRYDGSVGYTLIYNLFRDIVFIEGIYHIFCESNFDDGTKWKITKHISSDGFYYSQMSTPLFSLGEMGEFDEKGQADPSIIYDGVGDWKMWFDAVNGANVWDKLGYATSVDGETWIKYGSVIERGGLGSWDSSSIHQCHVVKHNDLYYMFYAASGVGYPGYAIGLATSPDGINWTKIGTAPIIGYGSIGQFDSVYLRPSKPMIIDNTWYMWYWGNDGSVNSMGLATSTDLINWTKRGKVVDDTGASSAILRTGSNSKDKMVSIWAGEPSTMTTKYLTVSINNGLTPLGVFKKANISQVSAGDTVSNNYSENHAANYIYLNRLTVNSEFTPDSIKVYINTTGKPNTGTIKLALYSNFVNTPENLIAISTEKNWIDIMGGEWTLFPLITPSLLAAGDYWVALWSTQAYQKNKGQGGGSYVWGYLQSDYGSFPNPITVNTNYGGADNDVCLVLNSIETIWSIAMVNSPNNVYFNTVIGEKTSTLLNVNSEYKWFWESGLLYIYCAGDPALKYQITYR